MVDATPVVQIEDKGELAAVVEAVVSSRASRILRKGHEDVAVIVPLARPVPVPQGKAGFIRAAGLWKDFDTEAMKARIRAERDAGASPAR